VLCVLIPAVLDGLDLGGPLCRRCNPDTKCIVPSRLSESMEVKESRRELINCRGIDLAFPDALRISKLTFALTLLGG
jgi:hypothetical protein